MGGAVDRADSCNPTTQEGCASLELGYGNPPTSWQDCSNACRDTPQCQSYTFKYSPHGCYSKDSALPSFFTYNPNVISGAKPPPARGVSGPVVSPAATTVPPATPQDLPISCGGNVLHMQPSDKNAKIHV